MLKHFFVLFFSISVLAPSFNYQERIHSFIDPNNRDQQLMRDVSHTRSLYLQQKSPGPSPLYSITDPVPFQSSNLPVVVINTEGRNIKTDPKIRAEMGIIDNGPGRRNHLNDPFNDYNGPIGIEYRGESSLMFPKKSFKFETWNESGEDINVSLLGLPQESDWILYAPYSDKSLLRNAMTLNLSRAMGHYASRTRFVELVVDGDYRGIYVLMEEIKQDEGRVDIAELEEGDTEGSELTGGYILRVDKVDENDYPAWESVPDPRLSDEEPIEFQYFDPEGEELEEVQQQYIQDYIQEFESALSGPDFRDPEKGYRKFIDLPSFYDFIILNELTKNVDAYQYSTYLYKENDREGGRLYMGPAWDYNLGYGNVDYYPEAQGAEGWLYQQDSKMYWFRRMMEDPVFAQKLHCRWLELRSGLLSDTAISNWIDSYATALAEPQERNFRRWSILGRYVWPNQYVGLTYADEVEWLKEWTLKRLRWMEDNLPKECPHTPLD